MCVGSSGAAWLMRALPSHTLVLPIGLRLLPRLCFRGFPGVAPIRLQAHITAGACWPAPADLVPCGGMRVIAFHNVVHDAILEELARRHGSPSAVVQHSLLHAVDEFPLLG